MALWDGDRLWVASVPGGPAFEAVGWSRRRGSELVDAVAALLANGALKLSGRFTVNAGGREFGITGSDVDALQQAKAAAAAAMMVLAQDAGRADGDLRRLCVCGAFGRRLNPASAQAIGLLPVIAPDRIELYAEAALAGCERVLLNPARCQAFTACGTPMNFLNLPMSNRYNHLYIENLRLRPFSLQGAHHAA